MRDNEKSTNFIIKNRSFSLEGYLCPSIRRLIGNLPNKIKDSIEEIRLRINNPLIIHVNNQDYFITQKGELSLSSKDSFTVTKDNIDNTLQFITNYSIYSVEEELKNGYITVQGGHRVGIVGKVLHNNGVVKTIKDFTGLNIRVAREKIGAASNVLKHIIDNGEFVNTLIVSPPQCGKTTLLRDIIKNLSDGIPSLGLKGNRVGVVDERSEIAACYQGIPQNNLGIRTDVLDACPKAQGMIMLIRAMSPEIIATDEIGRDEDSMAIQEALLAGIKLITTVHGKSLEDIIFKKVIGSLVKEGVFKKIIILSNKQGVGTIEKILDGTTFNDLLEYPLKNKVAG
ncbi:stage III sporulation protein AA [Natronincola peptidivorans]|uniref:Stage III sporulation protein AA n=1 Tax=Natronincola peptidivorans TaxID=426128 RepID=A0A1H9YPK8_9FIRM|nr:stage III sporulation protein AA [Natronincola peptidivorans]SES71074.1 stage III sporulation protein AA [Natronincola peptidivorans]